MDPLRGYWMGKSPTVREAVEAYIKQVIKLNTDEEWADQPYNQIMGWKTQKQIAAEYGVSHISVGKHYRIIKDTQDLRKQYFPEEWEKFFETPYRKYDNKHGGIEDGE